MLKCFDKFVEDAPEYNPDFLVFLPFTAILQWPMSMANGFTVLVNRDVNDQFRKIFAVWSKHLASPDSAFVLTEESDSRLCDEAMANMPNFVELFECDRKKPHWGSVPGITSLLGHPDMAYVPSSIQRTVPTSQAQAHANPRSFANHSR